MSIRVWTTNLVNRARQNIEDGMILKKIDNPFFPLIPSLRSAGLAFKATKEEYEEYIKCKMDILHFSEKYCYVKSEDGKHKIITLRDYQIDILKDFDKERFNILMASRQCGKALIDSATVYTKNGKSTIGSLKMGDEIYGGDGKLTTVISVIPQGVKDLYTVLFDDGSKVICCGEHIWTVEDKVGKKQSLMLDEFKHFCQRYYVQSCEPVQFEHKEFTEFNSIYDYAKYLLNNNIYNISDEYLYSSLDQRKILLTAIVELSGLSISQLVNKFGNFLDLLQGLGYIVYGDTLVSNGRRRIVDVIPYGKEKCTCIVIANNDKLFLTNNYIPTHNTICSAINILHYILFNNKKNVLMTANKIDTVTEVLDKVKEIYVNLPFFLQQGAKVWNQRSITLANKSRIKTAATTKTASIGFTIDYLYCDEFAYIPENIATNFYKSVYPTISSIDNSKITITSTPNGYNLFHKLLTEAELPKGDENKNSFNPRRVYWYQVPNRFCSYVRLDKEMCYNRGINKHDLLKFLQEKYTLNKIELKRNYDTNKDEIIIYHIPPNKTRVDGELLEQDVENIDFNGVRLFQIAEISTWKKDTIKNIGGVDAFNQEYDLKFVTGDKSLFDENKENEIRRNKKSYEWQVIAQLDRRLKWSYSELKWNEEYELQNIRNDYTYIIVDISEGLGQDYSVLNIFNLKPKEIEIVEKYKEIFDKTIDFYKLEQVGLFRSRRITIPQLAEILYVLAFEVFDPEKTKIVLEYNTYGGELLAHLPNVFNQINEYDTSLFFRYQHSKADKRKKIGIKLRGGEEGKNLEVKDFQELVNTYSIVINNETNISEMSTFNKHVNPNTGKATFKASSGNDDTIITAIHASTIFKQIQFTEVCEELLDNDKSEWANKVREILKRQYENSTAAADFGSFNNTLKKVLNNNR
jgi:hypothetical protein